MGSISPNVVIMTDAELQTIKQAEYAHGVQRGRFEEKHDRIVAAHDNTPGQVISVSDWERLKALEALVMQIDLQAFAHPRHFIGHDMDGIRSALDASPHVAALRTIAKEPSS